MVFLACKTIFVLRLVAYSSYYGNERSNRVCNMFGKKCNFGFIIKCLLKESPMFYLNWMMIFSICIFGYIIMILESPLGRVYHESYNFTFFNSCWLAICTMTTVGYGDIYPRTIFGKIAAFACSMVGVAMISLIIGTINAFLNMDSIESSSYTVLKKLQLKEEI